MSTLASTPTESHGKTPYRVNTGREMRTYIDNILESCVDSKPRVFEGEEVPTNNTGDAVDETHPTESTPTTISGEVTPKEILRRPANAPPMMQELAKMEDQQTKKKKHTIPN